MSYEFTSDEEIAGFRTGDKFVDITGFVDVINNIKSVNIKGQPSWLFAVILNNNSKLLEILGGNLSTSNPKFHNPKDNIHILEFNYQDSSKMITHGLFVQPEITHIDYQNVELENLLKTKIKYSEVKAYLKSMLLMEEGEKSHGLGKIVDHKENYVLVEIVDYPKEDERLKIGVAVKMRGVIYDDQIPIFQVKDMDDVDALEEKTLPISQVRKSFQRLSAVVKRQKIDNANDDI
ncbi:uncharacterized protein LOC122855110 [Aphidius gifuensis]|uniref:uncharacterized protein LOC122855110 n=1 Tax=Aphidius gifuensis TaxID=684658 RepID=UPI001CDCE70E|nr:uncharacterized protein LOC122855110 [Aphidius gifuensis]